MLGSKALEPSLVHSQKVRDWVGLRPGRSAVRLERERVVRAVLVDMLHTLS